MLKEDGLPGRPTFMRAGFEPSFVIFEFCVLIRYLCFSLNRYELESPECLCG